MKRAGGRTGASVLLAWVLFASVSACRGTGSAREDTGGDVRDSRGRGWPLVHAQDFQSASSSKDFAFSDPSAWIWSQGTDGGMLELPRSSSYVPPHRSPFSIALLTDLWLGDFALDLELSSTCKEYPHRDLCLVFGFESPGELRYAHMASAPDENAHNLFAVQGAPRARLAPIPLRGVSWGEGVWHRVRLEREGAALRVWFDGELVLEARDPDPRAGRIGVGSFDDTGRFRALRVYAPRASEPPPGEPFAG